MGLLGYGLKAFYRNKGRTLGIAIGVMIAITLISGTNIATDSMTSYEVQKVMDEVVVDIRVSSTNDNPTEIMNILQTVQAEYPIIEKTFPYSYYTASDRLVLNTTGAINWPVINGTGWNPSYFEDKSIMFGIDHEILENNRLQDLVNITQGSFPNSNESILLDEITAARYAVTVGDNLSIGIYLNYSYFNGISYITVRTTMDFTNLTIAGIFSFQSYTKLQQLVGYPVDYNETALLTNFTTMHSMLNYLLPHMETQGPPFTTIYNVLVDHGSIDVLDLATSKAKLKQVSTAIYSKGGLSFEFSTYDNLYQEIISEEGMLNGLRMMMLVFSLPALILGLYLTLTLYNQTLERRIGEIGQLKSKGATKRQISSWFIMEASFIGAIGGLIGYFGGFATSYMFLMANLQSEFQNFLNADLLHGSLFSMFFGISLGIVTCIIAVAGPIRRLNKLAITDATKKQLNYKSYNPWKSKGDMPALIIGALPIGWMLIFSDQVISSIPPDIRGIVIMISEILTTLTIIAPFLLAYGIIKVVSGHSPARFTKIAQCLGNLITRKNAWLIGRNIGGRPKQSGGVVFILALTICLGLVISIVKASEQTYRTESIYVSNGADLQISPLWHSSINDTISLKNQILETFPDIERMTIISSEYKYCRGTSTSSGFMFGSQGFDPDYTSISLCGINVTEYPRVVYFRSSYLPSGDSNATFSKLGEKPNGTLLLDSWAKDNGYNVGDALIVKSSPSSSSDSVSLEIVGFFNVMPGLSGPTVIINFELLEKNFTSTNNPPDNTVMLAKMVSNPTQNGTVLAKNVKDKFSGKVIRVSSLEAQLAGVGSSGTGLILNVLDIEYAFIVIIATAGVAIVVYRSFSERRRDIANLRARGMKFGDLLKLQGGEGTTLVLFGILLGLVGIPIAYSLNMQLELGNNYYMIIPRPFVIPINIIWQLGLTFLILVLVVWLISWREVKRTGVPEIANLLRVY